MKEIIMSQYKPETSPVLPANECYDLISEYGMRALRFKKIPNETMYHQEISLLAKTFVALIMHYSESPQAVISHIEAAIINGCTNELVQINNEISCLFSKRKKISPINPRSEEEISKLTMKMAELEKRKPISSKEMIQTVIYDTLHIVNKENGLDIPDEFYLTLPQNNAVINTIISDMPPDLSLSLEKNI
jgi:hypothetical protein